MKIGSIWMIVGGMGGWCGCIRVKVKISGVIWRSMRCFEMSEAWRHAIDRKLYERSIAGKRKALAFLGLPVDAVMFMSNNDIENAFHEAIHAEVA